VAAGRRAAWKEERRRMEEPKEEERQKMKPFRVIYKLFHPAMMIACVLQLVSSNYCICSVTTTAI
jgi:redox-regulated HSP33 family molecular chaperone